MRTSRVDPWGSDDGQLTDAPATSSDVAGADGPDTPGRSADRYPWKVLSATSIGVVLVFVNTSTMDVALPSVVRYFDAGPTAATWILLSYMLVLTVLILTFGRLADLLGRRSLYLAGVAVFTIASLGGGFAPDVGWLIAMRVGQAVGAAALVTNVTALLTDAFPASRLSTGLGLNATVAAVAAALGPVIGGAMVTVFGWRAAFLVNVPVGLIAFGWAFVIIRRSPRPAHHERFDVWGALLSFLALGSLVLILSAGGARGWTSPEVLAGAFVVCLTVPAFLVSQSRLRHPLVDLALLADRARGMAYLAGFLLSVAQFAVVLLVSIYLQAAVGLSPFDAGLRVTPLAVGTAVAATVAGRLTRSYSARLLSSTGMVVVAAGLVVLMASLSPGTPYPWLGLGLGIVGVGTGLFMTPNTSSIMTSVPARRRGVANGVRSMLQNTGFVVSAALALALATSGLEPEQQRAAYAGTLAQLHSDQLGAFTLGNRLALGVMLLLCIVGAVASSARGRVPTRPGALPVVGPVPLPGDPA